MREARVFMIKAIAVYIPVLSMVPVKFYYGMKWFFRGQTRKLFLPYYRLTISVNISLLFIIAMVVAINWGMSAEIVT